MKAGRSRHGPSRKDKYERKSSASNLLLQTNDTRNSEAASSSSLPTFLLISILFQSPSLELINAALYRASQTVGKSAVGGQCQSAYVPGPVGLALEHNNPGGSSVGSAVAVAAGYAPVSIGTEADGSTTTPAARAAVYGLVMTRETISLEGYMAISPTYASPGCMAKTVGDLRELVGVMLEASNAKEITPLPSEDQLKKEWEGISLGFVNHDYELIPRAWTQLTDMETLELVSLQSILERGQGRSRTYITDGLEQKSKYEGAIAKIGQSGAKVCYPIDLPLARTDLKFLHDGKPAINTLVCEFHKIHFISGGR